MGVSLPYRCSLNDRSLLTSPLCMLEDSRTIILRIVRGGVYPYVQGIAVSAMQRAKPEPSEPSMKQPHYTHATHITSMG